MQHGQITELTLGGFQVFADRTTIPMGPLTLLFGPNSAGKSAIADGLQVLASFCDLFEVAERGWPKEIDGPAAHLFERHWRVEPGQMARLSGSVELGVRVLVEREAWGRSAIADKEPGNNFSARHERFVDAFWAIEPWVKTGGVDELELRLRIDACNSLETALAQGVMPSHEMVDWSASVSIGGTPLLRFDKFLETAVHMAHPLIGGRHGMQPFEHLARVAPNTFKSSRNWTSYSGGSLHSRGYDAETMVNVMDAEYEKGFDDDCNRACYAFGDLVDAIWLSTVTSVRRIVRTSIVPASRTIPTRSELTYLLNVDAGVAPIGKLGLRVDGRDEYRSLAEGALRASLGAERSEPGLPPDSDRQLLDFVNGLLGEHLFKEAGYFVTADAHALLPLRSPEHQGEKDESSAESMGRDFLVTLVLGDASGRRFAFDEVGSGLGYVLPVLVALAGSSRTFIQQPELHLHPALQAELADALISVVNEHLGKGRQLVVETHSEHLLLRLLRRIRQGRSPGASLQPYALDHDDLVVLYVNPTPSGASTVKHLRVDADGDFLDRWPRGFFEERWRDLFDE